MGLDLTLLPIDYEDSEWGMAHSLIELPRNYDLFDAIGKLPTSSIPPKFYTYRSREKGTDSHYGDTQHTPYGDKLTTVTMAQLKTMDIPGPPGAYVVASPDEQRVALYWH